jgi:hypothetical protein
MAWMPFLSSARDRSGILLPGLPGKRYKRIARFFAEQKMRPESPESKKSEKKDSQVLNLPVLLPCFFSPVSDRIAGGRCDGMAGESYFG